MVELIGWIGAILFAVSGIPQAMKSHKEGHSRGLSHGFLWMWFGGEIFTIAYVLLQHGWDLPLLTNYALNIVWLTIIVKYKVWERSL